MTILYPTPVHSSDRRLSHALGRFFALAMCLLVLVPTSFAPAQSPEQQQQIADRFFEVLLRRPRPGTALDRVYDYHVQNGSLESFLTQLGEQAAAEANSEQAGARQMVIGLIQSRRGNVDDAARAFGTAETLLPEDAVASYQLGKALMDGGDSAAALAAMKRSIERQPDRREASDVYLATGRLYLRNGDRESAIRLWQDLIDRFPGEAAITEKVADWMAEEQQLESATELYLRLAKDAKTQESQIGYQIKAAELKSRLGQTQAARNTLQSILDRLRPGSWLHRDVRGRLERSFLASGDDDELAKYYYEQAERTPDELSTLVRLGEILASAGRTDEAEKAFRNAIKRAPGNASARLALVEILVGRGDAAEAAVELEGLLQKDSDNPDYAMRLGEIHLGDLSKPLDQRRLAAAEVWNRLALSRADDAVTLSIIAGKMHSIENTQRAVELYELAIQVDPDSHQYRESLGGYLFRQGRKQEAIEVWKSITEGDRRNRASLVRLAEMFGSVELDELELQTWQAAATLDLSFDERLRYAAVLSEAGKHDEALGQLDSAWSIVQDDEQRERWLREQIEILTAAERLTQRIAEVSVQQPTAENQRLLALLFQANRQLGAASLSIEAALKLTPDDVNLLIDAVEIAVESGRQTQAAIWLETLARIDKRFQVNHLRRLVEIREGLGEIEAALEAAQRMIDANPAAPESYRLYARLAFAAGNEELGERMLRRAIQVAPRSIAPRIALATRLAERFETGEAIELYWQAVEYESRPSSRADWIQKLVPLYVRRGEIEQFVARIERLQISTLTDKQKQILVASVWESVKDFKQAQLTLQGSLNKHPRDAELLAPMVDLLFNSGQKQAAVKFQRRLVDVDDTSTNQRRLVALELEAGLISPTEAMAREIKATDDPKRMATIAGRNASQDPEQAAELHRVVLQKRPDLWDVEILRVQLLLLSDSPDREKDLAEAGRLAEKVAALKLDDDLACPAVSPAPVTSSNTRTSRLSTRVILNPIPQARGGQATNLPQLQMIRSGSGGASSIASPFPVAQDRSQFPQSVTSILQTIQRLNDRRVDSRRNSGSKSYSFGFGSNLITPVDFYQAKWIARVAQILAECEIAKLANKPADPSIVIAKRFPQPDATVDDVHVLRDVVMINEIERALGGRNALPIDDIVWRIAELDPGAKQPYLAELLEVRSDRRRLDPSSELPPLDEAKLAILTRVCQQHHESALVRTRSFDEIMVDLRFRQYLIAECRIAGKKDPYSDLLLQPAATSGFNEAMSEIQAALWEGNLEQADRLVGKLVQAARSSPPGDVALDQSITWMVSPSSDEQIKFIVRHREVLIDAWLAHCSRSMMASQGSLPVSELFAGDPLQIVVPVLKPGLEKPRYEIFRLETPLSKRLLDERLLRGLVPLIPKRSFQGSSRLTLATPDELLERLSGRFQGATPHEQKLRRVVAAFATWWDKRPIDCYLQLQQLADEYPDDIDLQVESARLGVIVGRTQMAFKRLDRAKAHDDATRNQVELARIVLAAKTGNDALVRSTAQRLLGQPIDASTRSFLAAQLQDLVTKNQAVQSTVQAIARSRTVRMSPKRLASDDERKLNLAKMMLDSGDLVTASEIAFSIVNRRQSAVKVDRSTTRSQAIEILVRTGRLQALIEMTRRKFIASPDSDAYRHELADLYVAAGEPDKASLLWEEVIEALKLSPRQIVMRASTMRGRREFHHAAMLYLYAFERDMGLWDSHWNVFVDSASMSTSQDVLFDQLCKLDVRALKPFTLCDAIRISGSGPMSESQQRFARHVVTNHPEVKENLDLVLAAIPKPERHAIPELKLIMVNAITAPDAFTLESPLWTLRSWSEAGLVKGLLGDEMQMLWENPDAAKKFLAVVDAEPVRSRPIARLLKAIFELNSAERRTQATGIIAELCPAKFDKPLDSGSDDRFPPGLLWQVGVLIESIDAIENKSLLKVGVYQAAIRNTHDRSPASSSVGAPRDQLYREYANVGRKDLARRGWLDRFSASVLPRTTGVRENRQLLLAAHVSKQLLQSGFPVDAAGICRRHLQQPLTFELARRYSQGRNHRRILQTTMQTALDALDPSTCQAYLDALAADLSLDSAAEIDLYSTKVSEITGTAEDCLFELAVRKACEAKPGLKSAQKLFDRIQKVDRGDQNHQSIELARLILAAVIRSPDVDQLLADVDQRLHETAQRNSGSSTQENKVPDFIPPYVFGFAAVRRSASAEADEAVERVLAGARKLAAEVGDEAAETALAWLSRRSDAMLSVLDAIDGESAGGPASPANCDRCLRMAQVAAAKGDWAVVARAMRAALGNGPPIVADTEQKVVADPYGGSVATSSVGVIETSHDNVRDQVLGVLGNCRDQNGVPVTSPGFDHEGCGVPAAELIELDTALRKVLFPSDMFVNVYGYRRPVLMDDESINRADGYKTRSVSYACGNLARVCGTVDSLIEQIRRRTNASDALEVTAMAVDLAVTTGDAEFLVDAVLAFGESCNDKLPRLDDSVAASADPPAPKPIPPRDTAAILSLADQVVGTLWPLATRSGLPDNINQANIELLKRTAKLLGGNQELQKSHQRLINTLESLGQ